MQHSTTYTGSVGADAYATTLRDAATKDGVNVQYHGEQLRLDCARDSSLVLTLS